MRLVAGLIAALVLALAVYAWMYRIGNMAPSDTIEYQGQRIRLSRSYPSFEAYKDDPGNIAESENARVDRLVVLAPIESSFDSRKAVVKAVGAIKFPGYGLSSFVEKPQPDGSVLALMAVEIPRSGKERYLLFRARDGRYALLDDFVEAEGKGIEEARDEGGQLAYYSRQGVKVLSRPQKGSAR